MMRNVRLVLALLLLLALALISGFRPFYLLLYIAVGVSLLGYLWAWLQTKGLRAQLQLLSTHPQVGKPVYFKAVVYERMLLPRIGLHARVGAEFAVGSEEAVLVGPRGQAVWTTSAVCQQRGPHRFGSLKVTGRDPFGLMRVERELGDSKEVVVYPATVQLFSPEAAGYAGQEASGGRAGGAIASRMHTAPATVREYVPGDRMTSIHWPSTARVGQLMAKQFQEVQTMEMWLLVDLEEASQSGSGLLGTEEISITIAASLAKHLLGGAWPVGLIFQGEGSCHIPPGRGQEHLDRLLTALALARAKGATPLAAIASREASSFAAGSVVIAIQPTTAQREGLVVEALRRRGVAVVPILLDSSSFAKRLASATTSDGVGIPGLIRADDDLAGRLTGIVSRLIA